MSTENIIDNWDLMSPEERQKAQARLWEIISYIAWSNNRRSGATDRPQFHVTEGAD